MAAPRRSPQRALRPAIVLGSIAALVGGALLVAVPAVAVPDAPTITSPAGSADTVGPDFTVSGDLAVPSGYDYVRVQWRQGASIVDECFQGLGPGETVFSCTIAVPPPGIYTVVAQHSDSAEPGPNDWSADSNAVTVRVGGTQTAAFTSDTGFSNEWYTLVPALSGTGPVFGTVRVEHRYDDGGGLGEQTVDYCPSVDVGADGTWTCPSPPNPYSAWGQYGYFVVYGTDLMGTPTALPYDDEIGGDFVVPPPTTQVIPTPAGFDYAASGVSDSFLFAELYRVTQPEGDGYLYGPPVDFCEPADDLTTLGCSFSGLAPGIWNIYTIQEVSEVSTILVDEYVLIPTAPTLAASLGDDREAVFSGSATAGDRVIVRLVGGGDVCSAIVATNGTWRCTADRPVGTASYRAVAQSVGFVATPPGEPAYVASYDGFSAVTSARSLTIPAAVPAPRPSPTPIAWQLSGYDGGPLLPGQQLALTAQGLPPGTVVDIEIRSTPRLLGSASANADGVFALDVTVPDDLEPGEHSLVATATPPGGVPSVLSFPVVVEPAAVVAPAPPAEEGAEPVAEQPEGGSEPNGVAGDRANPASPSAITESIPTLQRLFDDPWVIAASGGLALALLLLVAFPAELLNSTLAENTGRLGRWFAAVERRAAQATAWFERVSRTRALAAAVLVGVTSLIFGFVDPDFGFDPVSVRMTVSLAIGLFLITYVAAWISGAIARRAWGVATQVTLQPVALLFAVVGVAVARVLEFSPGFLIGLVIGLDLISRVDAAVRARVIVLSTSITAGIAVVAWFAFSVMAAISSGSPGWVELLVSDALVATTAEGLTAALASMLPLGFLAGHEVIRHSKPMWAGTFIVLAVLFSLIVLPTAADETAPVEDMAFWLLVMAVFAVVTLSLWAVLQFTGARHGDDDSAGHAAEEPMAGATR